jgi:general secretion pathway protein K
MRYRHSDRWPPARQRGAALVVALLIFALCTALIVAMKSEFTLYYQRGANLFHGEQAYAYLRGAEELASLALIMDFDQDQERQRSRDDLTEVWAQQSTPYALDEGGWLVGNLQDLQGRFNLNALLSEAGTAGGPGPGQGVESGADNETGKAQPGAGVGQGGQGGQPPRFSAAQQQFIRLLQALEDPQVSESDAIQITEAVRDWLDADNELSAAGAEDDYYFGRTPSHRAANRLMSSVTELRAVANVTPEIYCALLPLVTVWPQSPATLNIHTAPPVLLRTINAEGDLSPLSQSDAEAMAAQRAEPGFADLEEFLAHPALEGKNLGGLSALLGEASGYFLLSATVEVADRTMRLYSVLERKQRQVTALVRNGGEGEPLCIRQGRLEPGGNNEEGDGA